MIKKKRRTIFSTPIIADLLRALAIVLLKLTGWHTVGSPPAVKKCVMIAAPHTSNWDFPVMLLVVLKFKMDVHWIGKHTLFPFPIGGLMRWLGGIPIDRSAARNTVDQAAQAFQQSEQLVLLLAPEGTRSKVNHWKAGFYHIAHRANVPVQLAFLDARTKTVGFGPLCHTSGDTDADIVKMMAFYSGKQGIRAEYSMG